MSLLLLWFSPDESHLAAALPLLELPPTLRPHQAPLSVAALGRRVCADGRRRCAQLAPVAQLVGKLSRTLVNSCVTRSREERDEVDTLLSVFVFVS